MGLFLGLGIGGVVLLAASLVFDGVLEGVFDGALDGLFDGWLSLPVIAGFVSMLGFTGAIVLGSTGLGQERQPPRGSWPGRARAGLRTASAGPCNGTVTAAPRTRRTSSVQRAGWSPPSRPKATARYCCRSAASR